MSEPYRLAEPEVALAAPWLQYPTQTLLAHFPGQAFTIRHRLVDHPLLQLPRLIQLARSLPAGQQEFNSGDLKVDQDYLSTPRTGLSAQETLAQIEHCQSWLALKNVECDAEYGALLEQCLEPLASQTHAVTPWLRQREAFIFVSSPHAITPYHMDPEHNFLLQVRGSKRVTVFDGTDRGIVSEEQLEAFYAGAHRNMEFKDAYAPSGRTFELHPGDGLYIPVTAPHWVENGDSVSVSFSVTFRSAAASNQASVYKLNAWLRSRGIVPVPPGRSPLRDAVKIALDRAAGRWQRLRSRS
jgi:hypothetical protein